MYVNSVIIIDFIINRRKGFLDQVGYTPQVGILENYEGRSRGDRQAAV